MADPARATPAPWSPAVLRRRGYTALLLVFRHLPAPVRRGLVRAATPGFTVGAVVAIEHDGEVLFLRQPHRAGLSLPGGLLDRGERPAEGVAREVREETGLHVRVGLPVATQVNARVRRVDVIYRLRTSVRPQVDVGGEAKGFRWLPLGALEEADDSTREIVDLLRRAEQPGCYDGEVLPGSPAR
ncbi:NUDIX hydrolase [uncultured Pseudokineococcus sp.]|uniref:NUDIX hydrolase n=1 Tax=uncultured Pseudokineococcus sp. TaxID=1642928 RepID=UPI002616135A|nr:NUDIX domain-containing protein [uncultured Pseudokineococcus sp.]